MTFLTDLLFPNFNFNSVLGGLIFIIGIALLIFSMITLNTMLVYVSLGISALGLLMVYGLSFLQDIFEQQYGALILGGIVFLVVLYLILNKGGKRKK